MSTAAEKSINEPRGCKISTQSSQKLETIRERLYSDECENEDSALLLRSPEACTSTSSVVHQLEDDEEDCSASMNAEYGLVNHKIYPEDEDSPLILSSSSTAVPTTTTSSSILTTNTSSTTINKKRNNNHILETHHRASEPLLPKTFTEPANLSELLKSVSSNFNKKFFAGTARVHGTTTVSPSESLISVDARNLHKKPTAYRPRRLSSSDADDNDVSTSFFYDNDDFNFDKISINKINDEKNTSRKKFKSPLLQGSSSFHLRQKDSSSKVQDICGQCPRCSKHGRLNSLHPTVGYFNDNRSCPCRICKLLNPATSPSLISPTSVEGQELGALCQVCGQHGGKVQADGRCSRYNAECDVEAHNAGLVSSGSIVGGPITCREQGVQVSKWSLSSVSSCSGPLCRICHSPGDRVESLMSPCRCSGSLKFVHMSCLLRWLEISRRKLHRAPHCELCGYKYQRHKIMRFRRFQCPPCSRRDKLLHITFVLSILIMIVCACTTIICFKSDRPTKAGSDKIELNAQEIVTLVCGVMFFCAFFLAMYVQVKAQATIYKLLLRFWLMNQEWQIEEYRRDRDVEFREKNIKNDSVCSSV